MLNLFAAATLLGNAHNYIEKIGTVAILVGQFCVNVGTSLRNWVQGAATYARTTPKPEADATRNSGKTEEINDELDDLARKSRRDGSLNRRDQERYEDLKRKRTEVLHGLHELKLDRDLRETAAATSSVASYRVDREHTHIMAAKVGQTVAGKVCKKCGEPMFLQWSTRPEKDPMRSFFWSCPNYYRGDCLNGQPWEIEDQLIIAKDGLEEYNLRSSQLDDIVQLENSRKYVNDRMRKNLFGKAAAYECPTHGEGLVLHSKRGEAKGLLDMYHLKCPRYRGPLDPASCHYVLKLKSAIQLAEILKQFEGRGIL